MTITVKSITDTLRKLRLQDDLSARHFALPLVFGGMNIIEAPDRPVLQLRPDFEWCSEEMRTEMNVWLLATFGMRSIVPDGVAYIFSHNIVMNPRSIVQLTNLA